MRQSILRHPLPSGRSLRILGAALGLASASWAGHTADAPAIVGEATMVIGNAQIVSASGSSATIGRGTQIRVGDRVETQAGGHVHVRFVDGGRLSVRPASRLQIENYAHSADQPALNAIKFRLDEGVVRSITGAWGEAARDKFRLNTPVAAIGVKGTDFVAKSSGGTTFASVYTGAITLTPLVGGCTATLGPCLNGAERLLSEDMKGQALELARQQASAQLVPLAEQLAQPHRTSVPATVVAVAGSSSAKLTSDDSRSDATLDKTVSSEQRVIASLAQLPAATPLAPPVAVVPPAPPVAVAPPAPPVVIVPPVDLGKPPVVNQLGWGRWAFFGEKTNPIDGDQLSVNVALAEAVKAGWELATVSIDGRYPLFRNPAVPTPAVLAETQADFRLAGAAAQLLKANQVTEAATVTGGKLSVDFSRSTYATSLTVTNPTISTLNLAESGTVGADGALNSAHTRGVLSNDRSQAAYSFSRDLPAGQLNGITVWGR